MKNATKGAKFEDEVETLLRLKGFTISRNQLISGTQIDLVASKEGLLENLRYIVECTDRQSPVGVDLVKEKSSVLLAITDKKYLHRVLIVTRIGFTAEAKAFAENNPNLLLLTLQQLEDEIIDFRPYVLWYRHNYENSSGFFREGDLFQNYVDLLARDESGAGIESLSAEVRKWLTDKTNNLLFLLGEFGSGKTSFCRNFVYEMLMDKYVRHTGESFTPILINLREYRHASNIQQVVTDTLLNNYGISISSFMAFERACSSGNILLALDGFDEMADRSDKKTIVDCFNQIYLLSSLNAKVLLTCRSNFFQSHSDVVALLKRFSVNVPLEENKEKILVELSFQNQGRILFVERLTSEKVREFIKNRFPDDSEQMIKQIGSIHDLSDLSTRPVLLDMILRTLPELTKGKKRINSAALYEAYTDKWTARDEWRVSIPLQVRKSFCDTLAWLMHNSSQEDIPYSVLERAMTGSLRDMAQTDEQLEKFKNDLQTCSFLARGGSNDVFRFAHKSFLEFFVARRIVSNLLSGDSPKKPHQDQPPTGKVKKVEASEARTFRISSLDSIYHLPLSWLHDEIRSVGTTFNWVNSLLSERIHSSDGYLTLREPLYLKWHDQSSESTLRAHLEKNLREIFAKTGFLKAQHELGLSEEIATFALELLANSKTALPDFLSSLKSAESVDLFANILRLSKPSEYVRSSNDFIKTYLRSGKEQAVKVALCVAASRFPDLVDIGFVKDSRANLSPQEWSYFLFELALNQKDYTTVIRECYGIADLRPLDKIICAQVLWNEFKEDQIKKEISPILTDMIKSPNREDRTMFLSLMESLALPREIVLDMTIQFLHNEKDESLRDVAVTFLGTLDIGDTWKTFRKMAALEKDPSIKKRWHIIEQKARDSYSAQKNKTNLQRIRQNHSLRNKLWRTLST